MTSRKSNPPASDPQPSEPFDEAAVDTAQMAEQPGDAEMTKAMKEEGSSEPTVEYLGEFGAREITLRDWELAGVSGQPAVRWDRTNRKTLPQSAFTEHALRVLRQDGGFRFTS